jgi:hypothetical protein
LGVVFETSAPFDSTLQPFGTLTDSSVVIFTCGLSMHGMK